VEGIGILHQKLTRSHDPETGPYLVPEFSLDLIEVDRQLLVTADFTTEDVGDHLLVGRTQAKIALVAILKTQQFWSI
jgi:hypothetical protein